jgi:hypothetical protein
MTIGGLNGGGELVIAILQKGADAKEALSL